MREVYTTSDGTLSTIQLKQVDLKEEVALDCPVWSTSRFSHGGTVETRQAYDQGNDNLMFYIMEFFDSDGKKTQRSTCDLFGNPYLPKGDFTWNWKL